MNSAIDYIIIPMIKILVLFAIMLTQAPGQLQSMNPLFRGMVYAAIEN